MSEKRMKETERRLRYRRFRHQLPYQQGVSPVVATLILILIAVAAAAALYLWLVGWQGSVTSSISKPGVNQGTFSIGGSTSIYPFDELAVAQYEANNTGVTISDTEGGTGAGMLAVCSGAIDIGTASTEETAAGLISSDGCPASDAASITITTVAYDAVDVIVSSSSGNPHTVAAGGTQDVYGITGGTTNTGPLLSINSTILLAIYVDSSAPFSSSSEASTLEAALPSTTLAWLGTGADGLWNPGSSVNWNLIPTTAGCGQGTATIAAAVALGLTGGGCNVVNLDKTVSTVDRSDASGTTQAFEARDLAATADNKVATSLSGLGFSGCGSNNYLSDCGINTTKSANGNPAVIAAVSSDVDSIGYASDGLVQASGSGVVAIPFAAPGESCSALSAFPTSEVASCGVIPTTGATGTIAAGITSSTTTANYAGWRPLEYVTLQPPTGLVANYISWLLQPGVNYAIAGEAYEDSIYSV